jgi:hypothetical protein
VPAERDGDLGVLRTGLSPAPLEEYRKPLRTLCQVRSDGSDDERRLGSLPGSHTLEANDIRNLSTKGPEERRCEMQEDTSQIDGRQGLLKLLFGRISCIVGLLLSAGSLVVATLGASVNLSAGAVGIALGVLGYFLGARRLGAASVVLGTAAVFFMAAASTGLIPGVAPLGHGYD